MVLLLSTLPLALCNMDRMGGESFFNKSLDLLRPTFVEATASDNSCDGDDCDSLKEKWKRKKQMFCVD